VLFFLSLHFLWKQESSYHSCPLSHTIPHRHIRGGAHLSGVQRATRNAGRRGRGKCARADNTQHTTHRSTGAADRKAGPRGGGYCGPACAGSREIASLARTTSHEMRKLRNENPEANGLLIPDTRAAIGA
jgi:hypothetical protein